MTTETSGAPGGGLGRKIASELGRITLDKVSEIGFRNATRNADVIAQGKNISTLREGPLLSGSDALVIAAGPSLHQRDTAALIRASGFDGAVIATDSALGWCLRHNIVPDLVVSVDPHEHRIVRWFGDPELTEAMLSSDDYFARQDMEPRFLANQLKFNEELLELVNRHGRRLRIALASCSSPRVVQRVSDAGFDVYWWNPMYDDYELDDSLTRRIHHLNRLPCLNAGGNVGSASWVIAHAVLGKRRVWLLGIDFCYYAETPYSATQYYKELVALVGPEHLSEVFVRVVNPHTGQEFYTDPTYLWYRDSFVEMAGEAGCETLNCTGGGILFGPGIAWADLREFPERARRAERR